MSNRASTVSKWIISQCKANIGTTVYAGIAPKTDENGNKLCHPFITLNTFNNTPKRTTCEDKGTYDIQFSIFETAERLNNVNAITDELRDHFDNLQDIGGFIDRVLYVNDYTINDPENKGWQGILQYRVFMV